MGFFMADCLLIRTAAIVLVYRGIIFKQLHSKSIEGSTFEVLNNDER